MIRHRFKLGLALIVPLVLYAVLAERASWRPRILRYPNQVEAVAYSSDGRWLACISAYTLELRDAHTEQVVWSQNAGNTGGNAVAFSPDGNTIVIGTGNRLQLWDAQTHRLRRDLLAHYPYYHEATGLFFTPNSARLITGGVQGSQVLLWDIRRGKLLRSLAHGKKIIPLAIATDGRTLALATAPYEDYTPVLLWNTVTDQRQCALRLPVEERATCATFSPDHKTLAIGTGMGHINGDILLWDIATKHLIREFVAHSVASWETPIVTHLTFSPDGQLLASSGFIKGLDYQVKLWDARHGTFLRTLTEHKGAINGIAFAPDSSTLAVACGQTVQLWRIK